MAKTKKLGTVTVDSGRLIIFDPAYAAFLENRWIASAKGTVMVPHFKGEVVTLDSFGGDGKFPVSGEFDDHGLLQTVVIDLSRKASQ